MDYILDKYRRFKIVNAGVHVLAECAVASINGEMYRCRFILDTGCIVTSINRSFLQKLGYTVDTGVRTSGIDSAGGKIHLFETSIKQLNFQGLIYNNITIRYGDKDFSNHFAGLLGMDILGNFNFIVDRDDRALYINRCQYTCAATTPRNINDISFLQKTDSKADSLVTLPKETLSKLLSQLLPSSLIKELPIEEQLNEISKYM